MNWVNRAAMLALIWTPVILVRIRSLFSLNKKNLEFLITSQCNTGSQKIVYEKVYSTITQF
jgi:hypothetical protein